MSARLTDEDVAKLAYQLGAALAIRGDREDMAAGHQLVDDLRRAREERDALLAVVKEWFSEDDPNAGLFPTAEATEAARRRARAAIAKAEGR